MTALIRVPSAQQIKDAPTLTDVHEPASGVEVMPPHKVNDGTFTLNMNDPASAQPQPSSLQILAGKLKGAFNTKAAIGYLKENWDVMLISTAGSAAAKIAVASCTASFFGPAAGIVAVAVVGSVTGSVLRQGYQILKAEKGEARDKLKAQFGKKLLMSAAFGGLFSGLGIALGHFYEVFKESCDGGAKGLGSFIIAHHATTSGSSIADHAPAATTASAAPAVVTTPAPDAASAVTTTPSAADAHTATSAPVTEHAASTTTPEASIAPTPAPHAVTSPLDAIKQYAAENNVSPKLKDALLRAESTNPRIHAQALDDIAVYAPKSLQVQAYDLLQKSASLGNLKAKADLITMEFYGNNILGIKANPEAAADKMVALSKHSKYAAKMVEDWLGKPFAPADVHTVAPVAPISAPSATEHFNHPADIVTAPVTPAAPVEIAPPQSDLPRFETPADDVRLHVETVTVETAPETPVPVAPVVAPAPVEMTAPVAKPYVAPDCKVTIDIANTQNITMDCADNGADLPEVGEIVTIERPPVLSILVPR